MADEATTYCPHCGGAQTSTADGLCPACLLATALEVDAGPCPYQVLAPMSQGRQSVTYLARSLRGSRGYVALTIHAASRDPTAALARYARWKGPLDGLTGSIAKLLDAGRTPDGRLYLASEFVAGWPLSAIDTRVANAADIKVDLARQIVATLTEVHEAGLAHLALDPAMVKCSMAHGPRATLLGVGSAMIVDGAAPRPEPDLAALATLLRGLGFTVPERAFASSPNSGRRGPARPTAM